MMRASFLIAAIAMLPACAPSWQKQPILVGASGARLCAKHHVPLITAAGYAAPPSFDGDYFNSRDYKMYRVAPFPNRVPPLQSLKRTTLMTIPVKVTYCSQCQHECEVASDILI
jgi:hypothetical protein